MKERKAALVYTPQRTPCAIADVNNALAKHGAYRFDAAQEAAAHAALPVLDRPVLRRIMWLAAYSRAVQLLVTDHLSSLGPDEESQVAVVGAFMQFGLTVIRAGKEIPASWYQARVSALSWAKVAPLLDTLTDRTFLANAFAESAHYRDPETGDWLPTSVSRRHEHTRLRLKELIEIEGLSAVNAAARLEVEGYPNSQGRILWYPQAARTLYKAGL